MTRRMEEKRQCPFCSPPEEVIIAENDLAFAVRDRFPVTHLHTLIIPRRHAVDYFELTSEELAACDVLLRIARNDILSRDASVKGFNIGANSGLVAGQSVFHCHIHLIPRREGDVENPKGGVRHVIPRKGFY